MTLDLSWEDVLEVGQGGPGCGLLHINGRQPKGAFRYLPPAIEHEGHVYASTFVPGGFELCVIDPVTLVRRPISRRLPYARLVRVEEGGLVYVDAFVQGQECRWELAPPKRGGLLGRLLKR
jgi:hypothetical protein